MNSFILVYTNTAAIKKPLSYGTLTVFHHRHESKVIYAHFYKKPPIKNFCFVWIEKVNKLLLLCYQTVKL